MMMSGSELCQFTPCNDMHFLEKDTNFFMHKDSARVECAIRSNLAQKQMTCLSGGITNDSTAIQSPRYLQ